jgi:hypothetical protein
MSALPPKADICSAKGHVRFTPESGHVRCNQRCPLWANSESRIYSITSSARNKSDALQTILGLNGGTSRSSPQLLTSAPYAGSDADSSGHCPPALGKPCHWLTGLLTRLLTLASL